MLGADEVGVVGCGDNCGVVDRDDNCGVDDLELCDNGTVEEDDFSESKSVCFGREGVFARNCDLTTSGQCMQPSKWLSNLLTFLDL